MTKNKAPFGALFLLSIQNKGVTAVWDFDCNGLRIRINHSIELIKATYKHQAPIGAFLLPKIEVPECH
ncbi:hypothetical protein DYF88_08225 [Vibrio cholerae]|nr:hypothetical protein [Vibrio cholerae]